MNREQLEHAQQPEQRRTPSTGRAKPSRSGRFRRRTGLLAGLAMVAVGLQPVVTLAADGENEPVVVECGGQFHDLTIELGQTPGDDTIVLQDCDYPDQRITHISDEGTLTIEGNGATIRGGWGGGDDPTDTGPGLAIHRSGAGLKIRDLTITGWNFYGTGGGIWYEEAFTLERVTITGNRALQGGGMGQQRYINPVITVIDSTISNNYAAVTASAISTTYREDPGGTLHLINSTVTGNTVGSGRGSAMELWDWTEMNHEIVNSTVIDNPNEVTGENSVDIHFIGPAAVSNSIIGDWISDYTVEESNTMKAGALEWLGPLQDNGGPTLTMAPLDLPDNPLVDAIDPAEGCGIGVTADQRGVPRPQGEGCDIGAVELLTEPDQTAPVADPVLDPAPNAAGWVDSSPVVVSWNWTDDIGIHPLDCDHTSTQEGDGVWGLIVSCTDLFGNVGQTGHQVRIDTQEPLTTFTSPPPSPSFGTSVAEFAGEDYSGSGIAGFECSLDGGDYDACASPWSVSDLELGSHTLAVRSVDLAGNTDATPASHTWETHDVHVWLDDTRDLLAEFGLQRGTRRALDIRLGVAQGMLSRDNPARACLHLEGFMAQLEERTPGQVTVEQAQELTDRVVPVIVGLRC